MNDADNEKPLTDTETILMALDQVSQTIDAMTNVVGRLRNYIQAQAEDRADGAESPPLGAIRPQPGQTLH